MFWGLVKVFDPGKSVLVCGFMIFDVLICIFKPYLFFTIFRPKKGFTLSKYVEPPMAPWPVSVGKSVTQIGLNMLRELNNWNFDKKKEFLRLKPKQRFR